MPRHATCLRSAPIDERLRRAQVQALVLSGRDELGRRQGLSHLKVEGQAPVYVGKQSAAWRAWITLTTGTWEGICRRNS